jgi:hypothetical protein
MEKDTIQDSTRVVLAQLRHGSILPGSRAEMWRDLYFLPGTDLRGGAFGNKLFVEGPNVHVESAVYLRGEINIRQSKDQKPADGIVSFNSCVTTPDSLIISDVSFRTRFRANVYTGMVNLKNAIVYGNLYAKKAVI